MYRHDVNSSATSSSGATNLYDSSFYFKTSAHNVYKVLFNGDNAQTGASPIGGVEPNGTGITIFSWTNWILLKIYVYYDCFRCSKLLNNWLYACYIKSKNMLIPIMLEVYLFS